MSVQLLHSFVYQASIFGIVACAVAYIYALLNPNIERYFRQLAQGVTTAVGFILILSLLTFLLD